MLDYSAKGSVVMYKPVYSKIAVASLLSVSAFHLSDPDPH
jgi:hypothetical protein